MTDEKARENFLKFGNPDGKGSFAVGIALPNMLQKKEYAVQVLVVFFVVVIFVIPGYFLNQITSNEKDVGGVNVDNRKIFTELINENMIGKQIPGILAQSNEFAAMKVKSQDELAILKRIRAFDQVKEAIPKSTEKRQIQVKPICLLVGYMHDILNSDDLSNEGIKKDLENILRTIPSYFDIMLSQTMVLAQMYKMGRSPKKITAKNIMTLIQFSQNLMQGGWINKDPYSQLPNLGENEAMKRLKQKMGNKTLFQYCMLKGEERKEIANHVYGADKAAECFDD